MWNQFVMYVIITAFAWVFNGGIVFINPSTGNVKNFLSITTAIIMLAITFAVSKKWPKAYVYLLPVYLLIVGIVTITVPEDLSDTEWSFEKHFQLML